MPVRGQIIRCGVIAALVASAASAAEGPHWAYTGHGGPKEWGSMDTGFASCKLGHLQSPIDIRGARPADLPAIKFDYKPSVLKLIDNGHTIQVNYDPGSWIDVGGARYELVQFHFHHPSEEKVAGKAHAMVAHLVHRNAEGKLAVVAILLDGGGASQFIDAVWKNIPHEKGREVTVADRAIDVTKLLPAKRDYYTYQGSLTTPPCSEGVTWFVLKSPVSIANSDIAAFARLYPLNARPAQPLNGRTIQTTK
jgi:carbonic anhydrase